ncbi:MAG: 16S rRNA (uracil(1498)-N(3))-methyltransferase [Clostridia bacterium]|nr:16S rRNA (uracil(1498)-N(3))-methyltransferase [Clostridia bacterium]
MHRFYFSETHRENNRVLLSEDESKHALQVLRLKKGAEIVVFDGMGGVYAARVVDTVKQRLQAEISGRLPDNEARTRVTLYQGLTKGTKLDVILQKCTELGVHAVQPVLFARCDREIDHNSEKNLIRHRRIALESAKQCGRGQVPMIGQPKLLSDVLQRIRDHGAVLVPWEQAEGVRIADVLGARSPLQIGLVIGPEGGIEPGEMEQLQSVGGQAVTFGPRILRTETAGMAALASILTIRGEL